MSPGQTGFAACRFTESRGLRGAAAAKRGRAARVGALASRAALAELARGRTTAGRAFIAEVAFAS